MVPGQEPCGLASRLVTNDAPEPPAIASGSTLSFGSPLSEERAARITAELATWLRLGRTAAAGPGRHARCARHRYRQLRSRHQTRQPRGHHPGPGRPCHVHRGHLGITADLVLNTGAWHALGTQQEALASLRALVNPGGRVAGYEGRGQYGHRRARRPGDRRGILATAHRVGQERRVGGLRIGDRPADPRADEVRAQFDKVRAIWLHGHRDIFGFAYLTPGGSRNCAADRVSPGTDPRPGPAAQVPDGSPRRPRRISASARPGGTHHAQCRECREQPPHPRRCGSRDPSTERASPGTDHPGNAAATGRTRGKPCGKAAGSACRRRRTAPASPSRCSLVDSMAGSSAVVPRKSFPGPPHHFDTAARPGPGPVDIRVQVRRVRRRYLCPRR